MKYLSPVLLLILAGCMGGTAPQGQANRFTRLDHTPPGDLVWMLPGGVPATALRMGNDSCYYIQRDGGGRPEAVRTGPNRDGYYCFG